jgi:hypothetical protein
MDPFYDPEEETVATAKNGRPVSRYYSELSPGVFVENQAEGTFFRGADGRMQSSIRGRERRGLLDRVFGVDDPALANERTWMDNVAALPRTVGRALTGMASKGLTGVGAVETGVSSALGMEATIKDEDGNELQTRPFRNDELWLGGWGKDLQEQEQRLAAHPQQRGDFLTDALPSGLTQVAGQISLAALVGPAAAGGAMVSQAAGAGYQDAIASGASEETALLSAALNAPVGALEMLPVSRLFTRVNKATGGTFGQVVKRSLAEGVSGSLEEAITEAASQTLSNAVAQKLYDEDRELFAGVGDSSVQGGAVGFIASALGAGIAGFRRGNPNRPRPEMVDGEYIPPPEMVDAVWLSDERGVARRSGELMGPFPAPVADGISLRELTGKDEAGNALPSQPGRNLLPGNLSEVRLSDLVDVNAPVDESLTPEEVARLPISHIRARDNAEAAPWVDEVEQTFEDRKQKILGRAGDKLSDTKHPIAQLRGWIRKAGGLRNDGGEIPPAFYNGISISYKTAGRKKSKRHWNDTGVTLEKVREWLAENAEEIGWQGDTQIDGGDLAQFLTGSFYDKSTGKSRFLTDDQKLGAMNLELEPRPLDRKLIEKVPVKVLFDRFNRDFKDTPYEIIPGDMEPGDILRIEDELYEVRKEGGVKVLVDGQTIELDPNEPVYVDAIVPKGHKMHKVFANLYQAVENRAARFPPDAMEAKAQEEAGLPPEVFDPTPAMDPDDIVPANASPEERAQRLDLYNQLLAAGRIRRRTPQSPTPAVDPRANLTAPGEVVTPVQADQGVSAPELAPAVGESLPALSEQEQLVLDVFQKGKEFSRNRIQQQARIGLNSTMRILETLIGKGLIAESGTAKNRTYALAETSAVSQPAVPPAEGSTPVAAGESLGSKAGDIVTNEDGSQYEIVSVREDGSVRKRSIRTKTWTNDYGKTWREGFKKGDDITEAWDNVDTGGLKIIGIEGKEGPGKRLIVQSVQGNDAVVLEWKAVPPAEGSTPVAAGDGNSLAAQAKVTGTKAVAQRIVNAENRFLEFAQDTAGLTQEQAEIALARYRKEKAIKIDPVTGQFTFTHGGFAEADVLRRAAGIEENFRPSEPPAAGTSDVRNEPFSLEAVSPEQLDAEQAAQREAARVAREREKLREGVAAPLVGSTGDLGQGRLFDDGKEDLFSGPSAEELAAKKKRPDPTANMDEIADRIAAERKAREAEAKAAGPKRSGLFGWLEGVFRFEGQRLRSPEGEGPALFSSLDPDTEAALSRNEKPKVSPWYKVDPKKVREFFRSFTRAFPEIPDAEHATGYYLEQMSHIPNAVTMISRGILGDIVTGLDAESYRLFQRVLVAKDLQKSMDDGLYEGKDIPFWKDRAALDADAVNWDAVTAANPHVAEALERRQAFLGSLVQEAIRFDLLPEGTSAEGYFHRIVTEYLEQQPGPGQKGMKDSKAGFQKTRKGSDKEYVTDYLTAEHDVISSILAKIEQQKVLASIEALNDRAPALRREARRLNLIAAHGGEANYNRVRSVLNQVSGIKAEAELSGELDSSTRQEMALLMQSIEDIDVLRPFRAQKAMAISILERAMGRKLEDIDYVSDNPGDDGDPNMLMGAAIKGELGEAARGAAAVWFKAIAAEEKFIQENLGGRYFRWKNGDLDKRMIPEGYTAWRRSDNPRYFKALSISEHVAEQVMAEQRKLMDDDVKEILATAGLEPAWIVPEHVARALNRLGNDPNEGPVAGAMKKATGVWKGWALQAPTRVLKYNFNNLTGDADFAIAAAPGILTYVKKAQEISWNINIRKQGLDSTLRKLALNGVIGGQMRGELPKIRQDELFSLITGEKPHLWQKYWDTASSISKWREDILRIAAYFYYSDEIRKGNRPFGAANYEQTKALYDAKMYDEAAMMLAYKALIDYNNPTVAGQLIKDRAIPFYSYKEGNLLRYKRLIENTWRESRQDADKARAAGPVFVKLFAKRAAFTGARIAAWSAIVAGMNAAFFPEEEEKLRKRGRRGHVIIGRNPDNPDEIYTMRMEGSLASFLSSLGVDEAMEQAGKVAAGDESLDGAARSVAASVVSDWVNSSNPFAKTAVEALAGISFWPDITNPRPIRDRAEHVLKLADADKLYNYVTGKPRDPRNNPLTSLLTFRTDMAEANYWVARANVMEWRKKQGMDTQPRSFTDQRNALYYYRKAQQYGDKRGEEHWLDRYLDLGGTVKGMRGSLDRQHPLSGLTQKQKSAYLTTLTEAQRKDLIRATKYYAEKLSARAVDPEVMQNVIERRRQQR